MKLADFVRRAVTYQIVLAVSMVVTLVIITAVWGTSQLYELISQISLLLVVTYLLIYDLRRHNQSMADVGAGMINGARFLQLTSLGLFISLVYVSGYLIVALFLVSDTRWRMEISTIPLSSWLIIAMKVIAVNAVRALMEELAFRVHPIGTLLFARSHNVTLRLIVIVLLAQALWFGVVHVGRYGLMIPVIVHISASGLLLGVVFYVTRSVFSSWSAHMGMNVFGTAIFDTWIENDNVLLSPIRFIFNCDQTVVNEILLIYDLIVIACSFGALALWSWGRKELHRRRGDETLGT